jgi:hypothetical protein
MTDTIPAHHCKPAATVGPPWCNSDDASHLTWDKLLKEPGKQSRAHYHTVGQNEDAHVLMEEFLDAATGIVTEGAPYLYVSSIDEFGYGVDAARARRYAAELLAAADKLDEITAAGR